MHRRLLLRTGPSLFSPGDNISARLPAVFAQGRSRRLSSVTTATLEPSSSLHTTGPVAPRDEQKSDGVSAQAEELQVSDPDVLFEAAYQELRRRKAGSDNLADSESDLVFPKEVSLPKISLIGVSCCNTTEAEGRCSH